VHLPATATRFESENALSTALQAERSTELEKDRVSPRAANLDWVKRSGTIKQSLGLEAGTVVKEPIAYDHWHRTEIDTGRPVRFHYRAAAS
jgi:hypothetical protein